MKTEIIKSFSSFACDAQLSCITFEQSNQFIYQVSVRYCVTPKDWTSNYQVVTFGEDEHSAKQCFCDYIKDFI